MPAEGITPEESAWQLQNHQGNHGAVSVVMDRSDGRRLSLDGLDGSAEG